MKKRTFAKALALFLILALIIPCVPVFAADEASDEPTYELKTREPVYYEEDGVTPVSDPKMYWYTRCTTDDTATTLEINDENDLAAFMAIGAITTASATSTPSTLQFRFTNGNSANALTIKLTADIVWNDGEIVDGKFVPSAKQGNVIYTWTPYGATYKGGQFNAFRGNFNGDGHTISGLYIEGTENVGMFSETGNGAKIQNVNLENLYIKATGKKVGGLVASGTSLTVSKVTADCYIDGYQEIGGLVGYANGALTIDDVDVKCNVKAEGGYVGGLVFQTTNTVDITNATVNCDITAGKMIFNSGGLSAYSYTAGIISYPTNNTNKVTVSDCLILGSFECEGGRNGYIQGCVRETGVSEISNCVSYAVGVTNAIGGTDNGGTATVEGCVSLPADSSWYGDGSATEFTIATPAQLVYFMELGQDSANTFAGKTLKLGGDIPMVSEDGVVYPWLPIKQFEGTLDGCGKTISDVNIGDSSAKNVGFIATAKGATVKNVNFEKMNIVGNSQIGALIDVSSGTLHISNVNMECTIVSTYGYIGGLVKQPQGYTKISNVTVDCDITATTYTGGIVGYPSDYSGTLILENCVTLGEIKCTGTNVGGILGTARANNKLTMTNCVSYASVTGGKANVAGVVGAIDTSTTAGAKVFSGNVSLGSVNGTAESCVVNGTYGTDYTVQNIENGDLTDVLKIEGVQMGTPADGAIDARFVVSVKFNETLNVDTIKAIGFEVASVGKFASGDVTEKPCASVYKEITTDFGEGTLKAEDFNGGADYIGTLVLTDMPTSSVATLVIRSYCDDADGVRYYSNYGVYTINGGVATMNKTIG